jgi:AcrR family transcriptional regulator
MKVHDTELLERIIRLTGELIGRRGLKGWNMDILAAEAGIAKNTLYKIITSKEDLIERVAIHTVTSVQSQLVRIIREGGDYLDTFEKLVAAFPRLIKTVGADSMREIFLEYPGIEKSVRKHQDAITGAIIDFIGKGIETQVLRNDVSAEFIFDLLRAVVLFQIGSGAQGETLSENIATSFDCLAHGLIA